MIAAENDDLISAGLLLRAGTDPNVHEEQRIGDTALKRAAERASLQMVELLLSFRAEPTIPGWMQLTPIHKAQERGGPLGEQILNAMKTALGKSEEEWRRLLLPIS